MKPNEIERQILEAIKRLGDELGNEMVKSDAVRSITPFGYSTESRAEFLDRLDVLEYKGSIRQIKHPAARMERMIGLAVAGKARLLMSEAEFQQAENRGRVTHTSHNVNVNAPIQNFAHYCHRCCTHLSRHL
jgi:hypothetical protein